MTPAEEGLVRLECLDTDGVKTVVEFPDGVTAEQFIERVRQFMLAVGYLEKTIDEALGRDG